MVDITYMAWVVGVVAGLAWIAGGVIGWCGRDYLAEKERATRSKFRNRVLDEEHEAAERLR